MSLLIEPANKNACDRNEKERKLVAGEFKQKSREEYMMQHIGLLAPSRAMQTQQQQRRMRPSKAALENWKRSPGTPQRVASTGSLTRLGSRAGGSIARSSQAGSTRASSPARSVYADSVASSDIEAPAHHNMRDPVQEVMMKGPPLFSPALCSIAATRAYH
eukprot:TRINITY_DN50230_c0_g1_i1.p1 TRINITY_DN50230_c0_g1~~TRINITY_DN50230_c0_g1_i1.p1  ORF type:complete len:161 (+),score=38.44 TRINITY_DN50230_c0_g1_i1:72-554(+)